MDAGSSNGPVDAPLTRSRTLLFISYRDSKAHRPRRRRDHHRLANTMRLHTEVVRRSFGRAPDLARAIPDDIKSPRHTRVHQRRISEQHLGKFSTLLAQPQLPHYRPSGYARSENVEHQAEERAFTAPGLQPPPCGAELYQRTRAIDVLDGPKRDRFLTADNRRCMSFSPSLRAGGEPWFAIANGS